MYQWRSFDHFWLTEYPPWGMEGLAFLYKVGHHRSSPPHVRLELEVEFLCCFASNWICEMSCAEWKGISSIQSAWFFLVWVWRFQIVCHVHSIFCADDSSFLRQALTCVGSRFDCKIQPSCRDWKRSRRCSFQRELKLLWELWDWIKYCSRSKLTLTCQRWWWFMDLKTNIPCRMIEAGRIYWRT
jgi:hypothetical protein